MVVEGWTHPSHIFTPFPAFLLVPDQTSLVWFKPTYHKGISTRPVVTMQGLDICTNLFISIISYNLGITHLWLHTKGGVGKPGVDGG